MNKENPVAWFEIYVDDMERAQAFYEAVLETTLSELPDPTGGTELRMMAFPMTMDKVGGAAGSLVKMDGMSAGNNSTVVYFESDDCSVEEGRVEAAGGKVHTSKMDIGEFGFVTMAFDSEGNMFGIHSMK